MCVCVCYAGAGPVVGLLGVRSTSTTITLYTAVICMVNGVITLWVCVQQSISLWATLCNAEVLTWVLRFSYVFCLSSGCAVLDILLCFCLNLGSHHWKFSLGPLITLVFSFLFKT